MKVCWIAVSVLVLFVLAGCTAEKKEQAKEKSDQVTAWSNSKEQQTESVPSSASDKDLVKRFMTAYVEQRFDLGTIDQKKQELESMLSPGMAENSSILPDIAAYRSQVEDWLTKKELHTSASVVLVERSIKELKIYQGEEDWLADVTYQESSPTINGRCSVHKQYLLQVVDGKIRECKEMDKYHEFIE